MAAYERMMERADRLRPLSAAGVAPRLVERGEAPVGALGRVYFSVQELVHGVKLAALPLERRPLEAVDRVFDALRTAGVALHVPDQSWLLSHLLVDRAPDGETRAYLLDGELKPGAPEELATRYAMFRGAVRTSAFTEERPNAADALAEIEAPKLAELRGAGSPLLLAVLAEPGNDARAILARHGLSSQARGDAGRAVLDLADAKAVMRAAERLLLDPDAAQVQASAEVKRSLEARGAKDVLAGLKAMTLEKRRAAILRMPASVYAFTESDDVAQLLALLAPLSWSPNEGPVPYGKIPDAAWRKLRPAGIGRLVKRGVAGNQIGEARTALSFWMEAHRSQLGEAASPGRELARLIGSLPEDLGRDAMIKALPEAAFARMDAEDALSILKLVSLEAGPLNLELPVEAFAKIDFDGIQRLLSYWNARNRPQHGAIAFGAWCQAHAQEIGGPAMPADKLLAVLSGIPMGVGRNEAIGAIAASSYAKMKSSDVVPILLLLNKNTVSDDLIRYYKRLPAQIWREMSREDYERLFAPAKMDVGRVIQELWSAARDPQPTPSRMTPEGEFR